MSWYTLYSTTTLSSFLLEDRVSSDNLFSACKEKKRIVEECSSSSSSHWKSRSQDAKTKFYDHSDTIGSSLRPAQLEISTRMVILIRTHTKKYTKGDSIKKFFAGYVGWLTRTICTKIGDNWINGTGNIDRFVFPTPSLLENEMRKNVFSVQKWLIWGENKRIFPGGMNKITFHQLNQGFSVSISVRRELPIVEEWHPCTNRLTD